jgi:pimeloyl-ACP methyl ester carboxylesterase
MPPKPSGHVDVGELELYYERHGDGPPLVLFHGAFGTIESCFAELLPLLAYEDMAGDMALFLAALDIPRAHFVGFSLGGAVGLQLALDRPELVDHLVFAGGASFDSSGEHPELSAVFESFDPHQLDGSRWHEAYRRVAPDPDAWIPLVLKMNELDRAGMSLPRERLAALELPTLLINGDADIVTPEHAVEMFRLLGGGAPGDLTGTPRAQLALLPGTSHEGVLDRVDWLYSMTVAFLTAGDDAAS